MSKPKLTEEEKLLEQWHLLANPGGSRRPTAVKALLDAGLAEIKTKRRTYTYEMVALTAAGEAEKERVRALVQPIFDRQTAERNERIRQRELLKQQGGDHV